MSIKNLFTKGKRGYIGLDVSAEALAAVQLEGVPGKKNFHVSGWSRVSLPVGVVHEGRIINPDKFNAALNHLFSQPKSGVLEGKRVILSLAEHQCYHKAFSVKKIGKSESLFTLAHREISQSVPYEIAKMEWDWVLVLDGLKYYSLYSVAVLQEVIEEYRKALKEVGMIIAVVEPQVVSASRLMFEEQSIAEPVVYLDLGAEETAVATIDPMGIHQSSVIPEGVLKWVSSLAKSLKIERTTAQKVLQSIGMRKVKHDKAVVIHQIIKKGLEPILREISQHSTYYDYIHGKDETPLQSIMINGEGALIPGLGEYLSANSKKGLRPVQSWAKFTPAFSPKHVMLLHNAIGAAIRGVHTGESRSEGINVLYSRKIIGQKKKKWWSNIIVSKSKKKKKII